MSTSLDPLAAILGIARDTSQYLFLEALLKDAGCGVAVLGERGEILCCNGCLGSMLGEPARENLTGRTLDPYLGTARETHRAALAHALTDQATAVVDGPFGGAFARSTYRPALSNEHHRASALLTVARTRPISPPPGGALHLHAPAEEAVASLTRREREVLGCIGLGMTTAEIALKLSRSPKTVEGHRVSLGAKLGVSNRVQLARIAIRYGLSPLSDNSRHAPAPEDSTDGRP